MSSLETVDPALLLRALEVYECERLDFGEAYLVAQAEMTGVNELVSFDRVIDRVRASRDASREVRRGTVQRRPPHMY